MSVSTYTEGVRNTNILIHVCCTDGAAEELWFYEEDRCSWIMIPIDKLNLALSDFNLQLIQSALIN